MSEALVLLNFDEVVVEDDLRQLTLNAPNLDRSVQDRAVAIMTDKRLGQWIASPKSALLFVNANCSPQECPTGYVSAKLAQSIMSTFSGDDVAPSDVHCLPYFCGMHTHYSDPDAGPSGIMRGFIAQLLLTHRDFGLSTLRGIENVDPEDVDSLCLVFGLLVQQMKAPIVLYCIVDNLFVFESRSAFAQDTDTVVDCLVSLAQDEETHVVIKVWFSSNTGSHQLHQVLDRSDILVLPDHAPPSSGLAQLDRFSPEVFPI